MAITVQGLIDHLQEHVRLQPYVGAAEVHTRCGEITGDFDILRERDAENWTDMIPSPAVVLLDME